MSANLDLARSIYDAWGRGDSASAEWAHPEIGHMVVDGVEPGVWRGRGEMEKAIRNILDLGDRERALADLGLPE